LKANDYKLSLNCFRTYAQDQRNRVSDPDFADEIGEFSFINPVCA